MNRSVRKLPCIMRAAIAASILGSSLDLTALELNRTFSNDMVLQRDKALKVWGTAKEGESVTVTFAPRLGSGQAGQTKTATADKDGKWVVTLDPMPASREGAVISVQSSVSSEPIELKNVVVGDVFLFARQSSIDVSLGTTPEGKQAADALELNSNYRFIHIKTSPSKTPLDNLKPDATRGWETVDKKSALTMSAAAFYLECDLVKSVDVPVGIVDLDMGYHFPGAWLSKAGLELAINRPGPGAGDLKFELENLPMDIQAWEAGDAGYVRGKEWRRKGKDTSADLGKTLLGMPPLERPQSPSVCYNAVIHPLQGLVLKGMLLQLGNNYPLVAFTRLRKIGKITDKEELGKANGQSYDIVKNGAQMTPHVLPVAPDDLRSSLGDSSLPMAWIMPPGSDLYQYASQNREVRELQRRAQAESKAIDLILPGTEHVPMSGQPADEVLLASRCKQWVMGTFYGAKTPVSGPLFDRLESKNGEGTVFFKSGTADGLSEKGDALKHFEAAAADGEFFPCGARIDGTTIKLTCAEVPQIAKVRYNWTQKPAQGLVNSAGLPALPFNTDPKWEYNWWPDVAPVVMPEEYSTPASKWPDRDIAIVNPDNKFEAGDSQPNPNHLGPTGLWGAPFGPNLYVHKITPDSPADGKVFMDDIIYGVNGKDFGTAPDDKYREFAAAVTLAETEAGAGKMVLGIRRDGKLIQVPIELEVMGSYSATSPLNCKKSLRIVEKAEAWIRNGLRPAKGTPQTGVYLHGPFHQNAIFMLASGNPELQGLVRRYIYQELTKMNISKPADEGGIGWGTGYFSMLLGEYYHRTGDPNVRPYLEWMVDMFSLGQIQPPDGNPYKNVLALTEEQVGAFRGGFRDPQEKFTAKKNPPTGRTDYGLMPACDMPGVIGFELAKEAGLKVDELVFSRALKHLNYKRAEYGFVLYAYSGLRREGPEPIDPKDQTNGQLVSMNGKLGTAAALFSLIDGYGSAVSNSSIRCAYAFNNTRSGHGGMFFNNFWTPIGAIHAGENAFQNFMKGQMWWRELYRDHTGADWQTGNSNGKADELGVAFVTHHVAYHKRLRILGAPRSVFGPGAPAYLKDALAAHGKRDYALAEKLIQKELDEKAVPAGDLPMVRHFLDSVQVLRKSVDYDLSYTEDLLKKGEYYYASIELPQLKGVVAADNPQLKAIVDALESAEGLAKVSAKFKQAQMEDGLAPAKQKGTTTSAEKPNEPVALVKDGLTVKRGAQPKQFPEEQWNRWRMTVLEDPAQTPEGWLKPDHDDSRWDEATLPISWPMGHTALLRTTFEVEDVNVYKALQVTANLYKQRNVLIYLNGQIVAKVNNADHVATFLLTPYALKVLKNGRNSLAVLAEHGKRNVDFSFRMVGYHKGSSIPIEKDKDEAKEEDKAENKDEGQ